MKTDNEGMSVEMFEVFESETHEVFECLNNYFTKWGPFTGDYGEKLTSEQRSVIDSIFESLKK